MQTINYNLRNLRKKREQESSSWQMHQSLDSLGNNLMAMLWMMHLSLVALQETSDIEQAKKNLQDALRAGNSAKDLMRMVLNSWKPKPVGAPIFRPQSVPKIMLFKIYYSSRENGEDLRQLINSSGIGLVAETDNLKHLSASGGGGVDVVILEYQENNSKLDRWIQESTANPDGPTIYLYLHQFSLLKLWKAMQLGVKECLVFPVQEEQLQAAVNRLEGWARTPTGNGNSEVKSDRLAYTTLARVNGAAV
jgi:hypothetical protein